MGTLPNPRPVETFNAQQLDPFGYLPVKYTGIALDRSSLDNSLAFVPKTVKE
jgi:hypothetical protein